MTLKTDWGLNDIIMPEDFNEMCKFINAWLEFKKSGGNVDGILSLKGIDLHGALYLMEGINSIEINPSSYSRIVRSEYDDDKGSFKVQLGTTSGTFEIVNKNWSKFLFKVGEDGVDLGGKSLLDQGFCTMPGGTILQWGKFLVTVGPNGSPSRKINFPISFSKDVFLQNSVCSNNSTENSISWTSAINCSFRIDDLHSATIEIRDTQGIPKEFEYEIKWFCIGK